MIKQMFQPPGFITDPPIPSAPVPSAPAPSAPARFASVDPSSTPVVIIERNTIIHLKKCKFNIYTFIIVILIIGCVSLVIYKFVISDNKKIMYYNYTTIPDPTTTLAPTTTLPATTLPATTSIYTPEKGGPGCSVYFSYKDSSGGSNCAEWGGYISVKCNNRYYNWGNVACRNMRRQVLCNSNSIITIRWDIRESDIGFRVKMCHNNNQNSILSIGQSERNGYRNFTCPSDAILTCKGQKVNFLYFSIIIIACMLLGIIFKVLYNKYS